MWGVWRLKELVVHKLLELGADPLYKNDNRESVSTYWDTDCCQNNQFIALKIATMLHNKGAKLLHSSYLSWSIVERSYRENMTELYNGLVKLGYTFIE